MYDDHMYCEVCGVHEEACWCFTYQRPDPWEHVCEGHE
jgi:hypothetical protein